MEKLFELTFQDQTLTPQVGTFTDASQTTGTFTLEDGEYYLANGDTKGFYTYEPIAIQPDSETDNKVTIEFDLKVAAASVNTHAIIGTYAGVDGNGIPTGAKITLQYTAGDIELVLGSGTTATLIAAADVVVDQWYHFGIDCALDAPTESTYEVKIDGVSITTVTGTTADYELGIISVLGTDLHACDECGIKNIRLITDDDYFVGRTALEQAFTDTKGYVDNQVGACIPRTGGSVVIGNSLGRVNDTGVFQVCGGQTGTDGASITLTGRNHGTSGGAVKMTAYDGANSTVVQILPDGTITATYPNTAVKNMAMQEDVIPRSGGTVITGDVLGRAVDDDVLSILGGTAWDRGAQLKLCGKDLSGGPAGAFALYATLDGNSSTPLQGTPSGALTWGVKNIAMQEDTVPRSGGNVLSGTAFHRNVDNSLLIFGGGSAYDKGAIIELHGKDNPAYTGWLVLRPNDAINVQTMLTKPDGTWSWTGSAVQLVSDRRLKQQITEIDDKLLDAWEDVELSQFKYNDAVDQKKDKARLHTGYVVQQIDSACKSHGVDISAYGLYCHEEYPQETEEVEVEQADGTKTKETKVIREASEHYSLRYTEVYAVECMYLRRCIARLTARIEQLEKEREASK